MLGTRSRVASRTQGAPTPASAKSYPGGLLHGSRLERLAPTSAHTLIADKGYRSKDLEDNLNQAGLTLQRPAARNWFLRE